MEADEFPKQPPAGMEENSCNGVQFCKVEGCSRDMANEKNYYRRYNVCEPHLRAMELLVDGRKQRFCQQCGKFQDLADFDNIKRSCRTQLARHSLRRRIKLRQQRNDRAQEVPEGSAEGTGTGAGGDVAAGEKDGSAENTAALDLAAGGLDPSGGVHLRQSNMEHNGAALPPLQLPLQAPLLDLQASGAGGGGGGSSGAMGLRPQPLLLGILGSGLEVGGLGTRGRDSGSISGAQQEILLGARRGSREGNNSGQPPLSGDSGFCLNLDLSQPSEPLLRQAAQAPLPTLRFASGSGGADDNLASSVRYGSGGASAAVARLLVPEAAIAVAGAVPCAGGGSDAGGGMRHLERIANLPVAVGGREQLPLLSLDLGACPNERDDANANDTDGADKSNPVHLDAKRGLDGSVGAAEELSWRLDESRQPPPQPLLLREQQHEPLAPMATLPQTGASTLEGHFPRTALDLPLPPPPPPSQLLPPSLQLYGYRAVQRTAAPSYAANAAVQRMAELPVLRDPSLDCELASLMNEIGAEQERPGDLHFMQRLGSGGSSSVSAAGGGMGPAAAAATAGVGWAGAGAMKRLWSNNGNEGVHASAHISGHGTGMLERQSRGETAPSTSLPQPLRPDVTLLPASNTAAAADQKGSMHWQQHRVSLGTGAPATFADNLTLPLHHQAIEGLPWLAPAAAVPRAVSDDNLYDAVTNGDFFGMMAAAACAPSERQLSAPQQSVSYEDGQHFQHTLQAGLVQRQQLLTQSAEAATRLAAFGASAMSQPGILGIRDTMQGASGQPLQIPDNIIPSVDPWQQISLPYGLHIPMQPQLTQLQAQGSRPLTNLEALYSSACEPSNLTAWQQPQQQQQHLLPQAFPLQGNNIGTSAAAALPASAAPASLQGQSHILPLPVPPLTSSTALPSVSPSTALLPHGLLYDPGMSYYSPGHLLQRLSIKLYGCSPADLMPDTRARLQAWLASMNLQMLQLTVRSGCAHLIADVLVPPPPPEVVAAAPPAGKAATAAAVVDGGGSCGGDVAGDGVGEVVPVGRSGDGDGHQVASEAAEIAGALSVAALVLGAGPHEADDSPVQGRAGRALAFAIPPASDASPASGEGASLDAAGALRQPRVESGTSGSSSGTNSSSEAPCIAGSEGPGSGPYRPSIESTDEDGSSGSRSGGGSSGGSNSKPASDADAVHARGATTGVAATTTADPDTECGATKEADMGTSARARDAKGTRLQLHALLSYVAGEAEVAGDGSGSGGDVSAGKSLFALLNELLKPRVGFPGDPGEDAAGQRMLLQLDDEVLRFPPPTPDFGRASEGPQHLRPQETYSRATGITQPLCGEAHTTTTASAVASPKPPPPSPSPAYGPELLQLPVAAVAAGRASSLELRLRIPPGAALLSALMTGDGPKAASEAPSSWLLHLRYGGQCLLSLEPAQLDVRPLAAAAAAAAGDQGAQERGLAACDDATAGQDGADGADPHACSGEAALPCTERIAEGFPSSPAPAPSASTTAPALAAALATPALHAASSPPASSGAPLLGDVASAVLPLPELPSPGLAVLETSCGDMLGRWLLLLVAPSEAVAAEVNELWQRCGCAAEERTGLQGASDRSPLEPFLVDLGRLLMLHAAGSCMEQEGCTEDWEAYVAWSELRAAMRDAAEVASRVYHASLRWGLPECSCLAYGWLLELLPDLQL